MKELIKNVSILIEGDVAETVKSIATFEKAIAVDIVTNDDDKTSFTLYSNISYEALVNQLVAEKYTIQDELAIQRKAYNGLTDEFHIYNAFVEECKIKAKQFITERERALNDTNR